MTGLIHLLVVIIVLGAIFYVAYWVLNEIPLPAPFNVVARVLLGIIALLVLIGLLLPMAGLPMRL